MHALDYLLLASVETPSPAPAPIGPLTRDQVCGVRLNFNGLLVTTAQYGTIPWFEPALDQLSPEDRQAVYAAKHACGDTHLNLALSHAYLEPGIRPPLSTGKDWSRDLAGLDALLVEVLQAGFVPLLMLAGDGESRSDRGYNDPVGWTYGYDWLMENLPRIIAGLPRSRDNVLFCPGYDAVFYGWEPSGVKVPAFGARFRELLPHGHLAIEHNTGHIPIGEGVGDWTPTGRMKDYDVVLSEFATFPCGDEVWQIAARLLGPAYRRPPDQPAGDDPHPPSYLRAGSARGPFFACAFEWVGLYLFVRGRASVAQVQRERDYLRALGYVYTG